MVRKQFHHMHATYISEWSRTTPINGTNTVYRKHHTRFISYRTLMFDIVEFSRVDKPYKLIQRYIIVSPYIRYSPTTTRQVNRFLLEYGYDKAVKRFLDSGKSEYHDSRSKTSFRYADAKNALSDFQFNWFKSSEVY